MAITIHFRGVQVMVKGAGNTMKEILFPNAEGSAPPDATLGPGGRKQHADGAFARPHFAGILVVGNGRRYRRSLLGCRVDFPAGPDTRISANFAAEFPSLRRVTGNANFQLSLLAESERERGRVATRIVLWGEELVPVFPRHTLWMDMPGHFGNADPARRYAIAASWTTTAAAMTLTVRTFAGAEEPDIDLASGDDVYLYCFDQRAPEPQDFVREDLQQCVNPPVIDHDFKWIYQLMDRRGGHANWHAWLTDRRFPAPQTDCVPRGEGGERLDRVEPADMERSDVVLIPVSTCYGTVDDGP